MLLEAWNNIFSVTVFRKALFSSEKWICKNKTLRNKFAPTVFRNSMWRGFLLNKIHFRHCLNAADDTVILDCTASCRWIWQSSKLFAISFHKKLFSVLYSASGIREPAASPCLFPWEREEQWALSPENKQLYSLEYSGEGAERWLWKDQQSVGSTKRTNNHPCITH